MNITVNPEYAHLTPLVEKAIADFDTTGATLKAGRNTVKEITIDGHALIVKWFHTPNLIQRIAYTWFKPGKARRAYHYALRLVRLGIDTPAAIAFGETRKRGLLSQSVFVSEKVESDSPGLFDRQFMPEPFDTAIASDIAALLVKMHKAGFMHGDINLSNILYHRRSDGSVSYSVIDTNRSRFLANPTREQCLANITRLTHQRPLLRYIVAAYARLRRWPEEECCRKVEANLDAFQRRLHIKQKFKKLLGK